VGTGSRSAPRARQPISGDRFECSAARRLGTIHFPYGQKIETTERVAQRLSWSAGSKADLRCPSLMQRDVRRPVAALDLLAGATWTGIVTPRIRCLVELSRRLLMIVAQEPSQPLAALHRLRATIVCIPSKQQDVAFALMVPLRNRRPSMPSLTTTLGGTIAAVCSRCRSLRDLRIRHGQAGPATCRSDSGRSPTDD
jgi:hypothetical protein